MKFRRITTRNYPRKSAERIVPQRLTIPLSLNEKQKRILTAVENGKNEIIVVDGPPGTGKSYTICAIVYLANQLGKSVVITSHKKQALDVIDHALTDQFKKTASSFQTIGPQAGTRQRACEHQQPGKHIIEPGD